MSKLMKAVGFISKQLFDFKVGMPEKYFQNPFDDYSKEAAKELIENNLVTKKFYHGINIHLFYIL